MVVNAAPVAGAAGTSAAVTRPAGPAAGTRAVHLTAAQARRLGIPDVGNTAPKARMTRKTARGPYRTRCHACGEEFTTMAGEDRHLAGLRHHRYELVLP